MTKKEKLLQQVNEAFAKNNTDFIIKHVTDDISWTVVSDFTVKGKELFSEALKSMQNEKPFHLEIKNIITHGYSAAVDGLMKSAEGKTYAFCDVYSFRGFTDPKIKEMTSYVIEIKE
jgi:ketosteroid isomerase-like protein